MLSAQTIEIIKEITPVMADHAEAITQRFYARMFAGNPEVKAFFNQAHQHSGDQPRALAGSICAYFSHIDKLEALAPAVEVIAQKHCSLGIQPDQYPIVGKHLLAAINDVLGHALTPEIVAAVGEAYQVLADVCIGREQEIYAGQAAQTGGWVGYRRFIVDKKVNECENIVSFYLRPEDGAPCSDYKPGQYITLRIDHPTTPTAPRNYSLSDAPGSDRYRISVKREGPRVGGCPMGLISNHLHDAIEPGDVLEVGPPCGSFTLRSSSMARPSVFLAGGIGITPLMAMAKTLVQMRHAHPVHFVHACKSPKHQALSQDLRELAEFPRVHVETLFQSQEHYLDRHFLEKTDTENADYYFCGPQGFMRGIYQTLRALGVDDTRLNFEFFGPKQDLLAGPEQAAA